MQETRVLFHGGVPTPLGTIRVIADQQESRGVPASPMRVFGSYALVLITSGGGWYRDALGAREKVEPGSVILVLPEVGHTYGPGTRQRWNETFITFEGLVFDSLRTAGIVQPGHLLRHSPEDWQRRFLQFAHSPSPATPGDRLRQVARLHELIVDLVAGDAMQDTVGSWLDLARAALDEDLESPLDLQGAAAALGMSAETFRRKFTQAAGVPPARYRAGRRIEAAANLLRQTTMTQRQIGESLGYTDEFHFAKRFKAAKGITPKQFRQSSL